MELNEKLSQQRKIIEALKQGEVPRPAFMRMGIASFTARCSELRKKGWGIKCHPPVYVNGNRHTYYTLDTVPGEIVC